VSEPKTSKYQAGKLDIERGGIVLIHGAAYTGGRFAYGWHIPGGHFTTSRLEALETARRLADLVKRSQ
jgi:hypothetical protein